MASHRRPGRGCCCSFEAGGLDRGRMPTLGRPSSQARAVAARATSMAKEHSVEGELGIAAEVAPIGISTTILPPSGLTIRSASSPPSTGTKPTCSGWRMVSETSEWSQR
jgi:hypothetical protein